MKLRLEKERILESNLERKSLLEDLNNVKSELSEAQEQVFEAKQEADTLIDNVNKEIECIGKMLSGIIDFNKLGDIQNSMSKHIRIKKTWAREVFYEHQDEARKMQTALNSAGFNCDALNELVDANYNRTDRDDPNRIEFDDFYKIHKI